MLRSSLGRPTQQVLIYSARAYAAASGANPLAPLDTFARRHNGDSQTDVQAMLKTIGVGSIDELITKTVPRSIALNRALNLPAAKSESEYLTEFREMARQNKIFRSFIGMGYYDTITPNVILRNIIENPLWYTPYTPYQPEISQGRLESLLNYQTMVQDLTGMAVSNASLLDEGTAAAEAMAIAFSQHKGQKKGYFIDKDCHPQTIACVETRAAPLGIKVYVADHATFDPSGKDICGALIQYPASSGRLVNYGPFVETMKKQKAVVACASDLLALTVVRPPSEFGVDIVLGNAQRFGVPLGYGGPHAAFFATTDEVKRRMPGRLIGVSRDAEGKMAYRMSLQTREQHIRREKATSNICTAQALLANTSAMYAVYHGPGGLRKIANRVHTAAGVLAEGARRMGIQTSAVNNAFFDTITLKTPADDVLARAAKKSINFRKLDANTVGISLDETVTEADLDNILSVLGSSKPGFKARDLATTVARGLGKFERTGAILSHPIFNSYHTEHELLRYMHRLASKDISLATSMIPLGSCTMKLNATAEMIPVTWPEFNSIHPFAPADQTKGYQAMFGELTKHLAEITGFHAVSLQPNSGAQGEYAGLYAIAAYHKSRNESHRNVCLIPTSAHGTNPASAAMVGMNIVVVKTTPSGEVDLEDLTAKAKQHAKNLSCLMVTYPSTYGVFEDKIRDVCKVVHENGGQVYMDGANMNAQVGLCRPGDFGPDVCHLNLHKTFCIPHGGGGPGMGPIGVAKHLAPFLPGHPVVKTGGEQAVGPISASPFGSSSILTISHVYIRMMGPDGLKNATQGAILNANYMMNRLKSHYNVLFLGANGTCAHEFILDLAPFKKVGIESSDIAKRLMDYGYHAPTMSFPVAGTLMIEPTESETKSELDRFCDAMISIRKEIAEVESGKADKEKNVLKMAPHTAAVVTSDNWTRPYSRQQAAFPAPWTLRHKHWPAASRIDDAYGDRNLVCSCPPVTDYA